MYASFARRPANARISIADVSRQRYHPASDEERSSPGLEHTIIHSGGVGVAAAQLLMNRGYFVCSSAPLSYRPPVLAAPSASASVLWARRTGCEIRRCFNRMTRCVRPCSLSARKSRAAGSIPLSPHPAHLAVAQRALDTPQVIGGQLFETTPMARKPRESPRRRFSVVAPQTTAILAVRQSASFFTLLKTIS